MLDTPGHGGLVQQAITSLPAPLTVIALNDAKRPGTGIGLTRKIIPLADVPNRPLGAL